MEEIVTVITAAVNEQLESTKEIAKDLSQASSGIHDVNDGVVQSSSSYKDISYDIREVHEISSEMSGTCSLANTNAEKLGKLAIIL